jgi:hypothetical protein
MINYELIENEVGRYIQRTLDGVISFIPIDEANSDYQAYLKYLEDNK